MNRLVNWRASSADPCKYNGKPYGYTSQDFIKDYRFVIYSKYYYVQTGIKKRGKLEIRKMIDNNPRNTKLLATIYLNPNVWYMKYCVDVVLHSLALQTFSKDFDSGIDMDQFIVNEFIKIDKGPYTTQEIAEQLDYSKF